MKPFFVFFFALLLVSVKLNAATVDADFSAANKLYAEGKFANAAQAYDTLIQNGTRSTALYFNDANAHFKAGQLGLAIAGYRQAALLSPRDANVKANLDFVRKQVQGSAFRESHWASGLSVLTLNEWSVLTAVAFWLTFGLLAARQIRPALALSLKNLTLCCAVLTIGCGGALALEANDHLSATSAVIIANEATARSGPFDEAQTVFTAHDGAELTVLSRHNVWVQVTDETGKIGWLPGRLVAVLPAA